MITYPRPPRGCSAVITGHGKPVGRLIPTTLSLEDRIEALRYVARALSPGTAKGHNQCPLWRNGVGRARLRTS